MLEETNGSTFSGSEQMKILKWIASVALLTAMTVSTASAATYLIDYLGTGGPYNLTGTGGGNIYSATDPANYPIDTSVAPGVGVNSTFTHDYTFTVTDIPGVGTQTFINVSVGATAIANLTFEWLGLGGPHIITDGAGNLTGTSFTTYLLNGAQTLRVTGLVINASTPGPLSTAYDFAITAVVPIPAAFWLFGSALVAFIGFGRRSATA